MVIGDGDYPEAVLSGGQNAGRHHKDVVAASDVDIEQEANEVAVVVLA